MKSHIKFLIETIGDIHVTEFNQDLLRTYREKLNIRTITKNGVKVESSNQTKNDYLRSCKRLFDYAKAFYVSDINNLFDNPGLLFKIRKQDKKVRIPYSNDELRELFSSEIYTEGKFRHPYHYWIPLIALYTGSRANEICQLRTDDIVEIDGVICISHKLSSEDKQLKLA